MTAIATSKLKKSIAEDEVGAIISAGGFIEKTEGAQLLSI